MAYDGVNIMSGTVTSRVTDSLERSIGRYNEIPILDTRVYEVTFPDGISKEYSANIIAGNIYIQVNSVVNYSKAIHMIIDHMRDDSILNNMKENKKYTTKGWNFYVKWKESTSTWIPLKDMKESSPVETTEYCFFKSGID